MDQAAGDAEAQEEESTGADDEQSPVSYPAGSEDIQANALADGTFTGRANVDDGELFKYVICADVVIKDGAIESVTTQITDDESEDPEDNEAYIDYAVNGRTRRGVTTAGIPSQVVEKQGVSGVDTVSGATYSSKGIIEAVRDALTQAAANGPADDEKGTKTQDSEEETSSPADQNEEGGKEPEEHAEPETGDQQITSVYKDGIYTASSWCEDGDMFRYRVTVTVIITDGRIETMKYEVTDDGSLEGIDNEPYIRRALDEEQEGSISARIISKGSADNVDAVSGATYTSYAMITAAKLALAEALH